MKISTKFAIIFSAAFLAMAISFIIALTTINTIKIGGDNYKEIIKFNDLRADILPPPAYIIETYLLCYQMIDESDAHLIAQRIERLGQLESEFKVREAIWLESLKNEDLKRTFSNEASGYANEFYSLIDKDFIPAIKGRDFTSASLVLNDELKPVFENHRAKIVETVGITEKVASETENEIVSGMDGSILLLIIISIALMATLLIVIFSISRSIIRPIKKATIIAKHLSNGNFDKAELEINNTV